MPSQNMLLWVYVLNLHLNLDSKNKAAIYHRVSSLQRMKSCKQALHLLKHKIPSNSPSHQVAPPAIESIASWRTLVGHSPARRGYDQGIQKNMICKHKETCMYLFFAIHVGFLFQIKLLFQYPSRSESKKALTQEKSCVFFDLLMRIVVSSS